MDYSSPTQAGGSHAHKRRSQRGGNNHYTQFESDVPIAYGYSAAGIALTPAQSALANPVPYKSYSQCPQRGGGKGDASDMRKASALRRDLGPARGTKRRRSSGSPAARRTRHKGDGVLSLVKKMKSLRLSGGRRKHARGRGHKKTRHQKKRHSRRTRSQRGGKMFPPFGRGGPSLSQFRPILD